MSAWLRSESGSQSTPEGMGGAGAGAPRGERGIAPFERRGSEGRSSLSLAASLLICALGGVAATSSMSLLAPMLIAYGLNPTARRPLPERAGCLAVTLVPAFVLSISSGLPTALTVLVSCLVVFVAGELIACETLTPGVTCALVAAAAAAHFGCDALETAAYGTTVPEVIDVLLASYLQEYSGTALEVVAQLQLVVELIALLWPVAYVATALGELLLALVGARAAAARRAEGQEGLGVRPPARLPRLVDFDLPLWVVAVFVASAAGLAVALTVSGSVSDVTLAVSANVALSVRFALAAQGIAVLAWLLRSKGASRFVSAFVWGAALYLEVQFVVLTVAGLVDVWANFRHLPRGGVAATGGDGAAKQD